MDKNKSVLFILGALDGGGAEKIFIDYIENLDNTNLNIKVCLIMFRGKYLNRIPEKCTLKYLWKNPYLYLLSFFLYKYFSIEIFLKRKIRSRFRGEKFDAIISFTEGIPVIFHDFIMGLSDNNLTWVHTDFQKNHYSKKWFFCSEAERRIYYRMKSILFVSSEAKRSFEKVFFSVNSGCVIYNPILRDKILKNSSSEFERLEEDKIHLICLGRLEKIKRVDRVIKALALLVKEKIAVHLNIVGEGPCGKELKELVASCHLENHVTFWGFISNPYPLLSQCRIFVQSSDAEGYPLALCEALTLGIPVVCTSTTGAKEILEDGLYGKLCDFNDQAIFESLYDLATDCSLYEKYKEKAIIRSKLFAPDEAISTLLSLL